MDQSDVEGLAVETYERAGLDPSEPANPFKLIRLTLGADALIRVTDLRGTPAALFWHNGRPRIAVRRNLPVEYEGFFALHELAHAVLARDRYVGLDEERVCDALAACAMAPRPAVHRLYRAFGLAFAPIAAEACSTQSWAAMRLAETQRFPLALVAPKTVRFRGQEWVWGSDADVRKMAVARAKPGLAKVRLTDDRRRVAMMADELAEDVG